MSTRSPTVAGLFYPGDRSALEAEVETALGDRDRTEKPVAVMVPHAGYVYSGATAGVVFGRLAPVERVILIGPNHTGLGAPVSIDSHRSWRTPLGDVELDEETIARLLESDGGFEREPAAHRREHSLEVQLPFLQRISPGARIVPIVVGGLSLVDCHRVGEAIASVVVELPALIVASSDLNHYEAEEPTLVKDEIALDAFRSFDADRLFGDVREHRVSMCGILPVTIAMIAARRLGAESAEVLAHTTSAAASGDSTRVVGYGAGVLRAPAER